MSNETNKTNYASGSNQGNSEANKLSSDKPQTENKAGQNGKADKDTLNEGGTKSEASNQDKTGPVAQDGAQPKQPTRDEPHKM